MSRRRIGEIAETLLDYVEHDRTFQTDGILTVPAQDYTDANRWRAEMDLIFKRLPLMLALSCEIPKPGDYKTMEVVGVPLLLTRSKAGGVRVFLNVCAHRWAPVAGKEYGNCSRFVCPFHGWTYGTDGKLLGVADQKKFGDIDKASHGLKELPCEERHGMIFARLSADVPLDLDGYYGELLDELADFGLKKWAFLGSRVFEGGNWKLTFNNFLESYHFATLHANTVAAHAVSNVNHFEGFGPNIRTSVVQRSISQLRNVARAEWGEREGREFTFIRIFFPNVTGSLSFEPDISLFTQTFPGSAPDTCRIVLLYLRKEPPKDAAESDAIEKAIDHSTFEVARDQDNAVCLQIQKGLESNAHQGLLFGRNEAANQYFHRWLNWYLEADSTAPKPVM